MFKSGFFHSFEREHTFPCSIFTPPTQINSSYQSTTGKKSSFERRLKREKKDKTRVLHETDTIHYTAKAQTYKNTH